MSSNINCLSQNHSNANYLDNDISDDNNEPFYWLTLLSDDAISERDLIYFPSKEK